MADAPAAQDPCVVQTFTPYVMTEADTAEVDRLYLELKPLATASARDFVLARTPANYQEAMTAKIDADWPVPPV